MRGLRRTSRAELRHCTFLERERVDNDRVDARVAAVDQTIAACHTLDLGCGEGADALR